MAETLTLAAGVIEQLTTRSLALIDQLGMMADVSDENDETREFGYLVDVLRKENRAWRGF